MDTNAAILTSSLTAAQRSDVAHFDVVVHGSGRNFVQEISASNHRFQADEPLSFGGSDIAPDPYDYLMASLGACTSMMVGLQARKRKWPLENIGVSLRHSRIHANDCEECLTRDGTIDRIEVAVELTGRLTAEQRSELMKTAGDCPIHRALTGEINIRLLAENGE
ncbi:MAG: OsmC family protein [Nitrospirota bacterium]|jgi:putative redox protein